MLTAERSILNNLEFAFKVYQELMAKKIASILLVSSPYDAFIMEEDGSLAERIIYEYRGLNLSRPPMLNWVSSARKALRALATKKYDIVIVMPRLEDMEPYELCRQIKQRYPRLPVFFLAHDIGTLMPDPKYQDRSVIDRTFIWRGDTDLLLALVKSAEDRMNVAYDSHRAKVRVIIFVEDSPFYRSTLLPYIYKEIVMQTQAIMNESLNEEHRMLQMRARPKLLIAEDFEEAEDLFRRFKRYLMCVFSDVRFPRYGEMDDEAGFSLLRMIKSECPDLPVLMLSTEETNRTKAERIPAVFLNKNSPSFHADMRYFFMNNLGFGDFVFRLPDGTVVARASNLRTLESILHSIPDESIDYHANRNDFSTWLIARFEIQLASELRHAILEECSGVQEIRRYLISALHRKLDKQRREIVAEFKQENFFPDSDFTKIGRGSLGGKARGLAFISTLIKNNPALTEKFSGVKITIPKTLVITTEGFDAFVNENNLKDYVIGDKSDARIVEDFLKLCIPDWLSHDLALFLAKVRYPLAVRSSSILEDSPSRPSAGTYETYMVPNNHPDLGIRLEQLMRAVKKVYASTFLETPRRFAAGSLYRAEEDKMAVIIQQLAGRPYDGYFYPAVSGVAQSYNFYPVSYMKPEEGIAFIALGFGKTVVEGGVSLRFSPKYPEFLPQFSTVDETLQYSQHYFYALKIGEADKAVAAETDITLERLAVEDFAHHEPVQRLASLYDPQDHRIRDAAAGSGYPVLTFAPILKYKLFPLVEILNELLDIGQKGMGCPVEIEFAVNLSSREDEPPEFSLLQIRPMVTCLHDEEIEITEEEIKKAFCYSTQAMGNSKTQTIRDVVYVKPEAFDAAHTIEIASQIGSINAILEKGHRRYLLAGLGRWGSADRWLGIPVRWNDISGVGNMIEAETDKLRAELSQGTHFFHNITSLGIGYLTISDKGDDFIDWEWLDSMPAENETAFVRHVSLAKPMVLKINGRQSRAAIIK